MKCNSPFFYLAMSQGIIHNENICQLKINDQSVLIVCTSASRAYLIFVFLTEKTLINGLNGSLQVETKRFL